MERVDIQEWLSTADFWQTLWPIGPQPVFFFTNEFHIFIKLSISFFLLFETYFKYFVLWRPGNWYSSFQIKEDGEINYVFFLFFHIESDYTKIMPQFSLSITMDIIWCHVWTTQDSQN